MHLWTSFNNVEDGELGPQPISVDLTVASGKVASDLTDFVVFVDLADITDAPWWAQCLSDGANIRVTDDSNNVIPFDLVVVDQGAETGHLYFKASLLSASDNDFKVQVLGAGQPIAVDDPLGRNEVWSDYKAMWDFGNIELTDRTGNGYDQELKFGATIASGWLVLDGVSDHGRSSEIYPGSGPTDWTISATVIWDSVATTKHRCAFSFSQNTTTNTSRETANLRSSPNVMAIWNTTDGWQDGTVLPVVSTRYRVALWHQGTTARELFMDGVADAVDAGPVAQKPSSTHQYVFLGVEDNTKSDDLLGQINYAYLREEIMSDDWLLAEYDSWEAPGTFYAIT